MRRSRAFTLMELLVYLALITSSLALIAGLEVSARRSSLLERGLIDIQLQTNQILVQFESDIAEAVVCSWETKTVDGVDVTVLEARQADGRRVRYTAKAGHGLLRELVFASGEVEQRHPFHLVERADITLDRGGETPLVVLDLTLRADTGPKTYARRRCVLCCRQRVWEAGR